MCFALLVTFSFASSVRTAAISPCHSYRLFCRSPVAGRRWRLARDISCQGREETKRNETNERADKATKWIGCKATRDKFRSAGDTSIDDVKKLKAKTHTNAREKKNRRPNAKYLILDDLFSHLSQLKHCSAPMHTEISDSE